MRSKGPSYAAGSFPPVGRIINISDAPASDPWAFLKLYQTMTFQAMAKLARGFAGAIAPDCATGRPVEAAT